MPRSVIDNAGISGSGTLSSTAMIAASSIVASSLTRSSLYLLESESDSLAHPDAHGRERELAAVPLQLLGRGERKPRARHAERMAERDRTAVWVHLRRVVRKSKLAKDGQRLRRERLVELDHVEVLHLHAEPFRQLFGSRSGTHTHDARRDAGDRGSKHACLWREAVALGGLFRRDDDRGRAVVDAGGIAGGHGAVGAHDRLELRERLEVGRAGMLVLFDDDGLALALGDLDGDDLRPKPPIRLGRGRLLLAAEGERVLVL